MSDDYDFFKFSITCQTDDLAVVFCLRALCQFAEQHKYPQIGWGGSGESSWRANSNNITLRFTSSKYRDKFIDEANRLLHGRWSQININNNDPAERQRKR